MKLKLNLSVVMSCLAVAAATCGSPAVSQAQKRTLNSRNVYRGHLSTNSSAKAKAGGSFVSRGYKQRVEKMFGPSKRMRLQTYSTASGGDPSGEMLIVDGKNKGFFWDRQEEEIVVVMFVNAEDPTGVFVENLRPNDVVSVREMAGIASFSDNKDEKEALSGFIGLLATGASVAKPELKDALNKAQKEAEKLFGLIPNTGKKRTADGREAGKSSYARQEGGVIVCLPGSGGTFESGPRGKWGLTGSDRWIKEGKGARTDNRIPKHVKQAYFPIQGKYLHNSRKVTASGALIIAPWDYKFEDNKGFYRLHVHIKRGEPVDPDDIVVTSTTSGGSGKANRPRSPRPDVVDKRTPRRPSTTRPNVFDKRTP